MGAGASTSGSKSHSAELWVRPMTASNTTARKAGAQHIFFLTVTSAIITLVYAALRGLLTSSPQPA